jgi:2-succinyl-6-hydroxy-2,4-cyclohexadiene-1-carboxylate synthase
MNSFFKGLHFYTSGKSTHTPLVLVHGFMGSASDWDLIVQKLNHKYFCISIDLPGHGQSTNLNQLGDIWKFEHLSKRILNLLNSLNINSVNLAGYSLGGRVALNFAVAFPQFVSTLILESTSPGLQNPEDRKARIKRDQNLANKLEHELLKLFLERWYDLPLFGEIKNHTKYPDLLRRRLKNNPALLAKALEAFSPGRQPGLWDKFPALTMPVNLICGEKDIKYLDMMKTIKKNNPRFSLKIFKSCGHNVHFEKPVLFAEHLLDVLS